MITKLNITRRKLYIFLAAIISAIIICSLISGGEVNYNKTKVDLSESLTWDYVDKTDFPSDEEINSGFKNSLTIGRKCISKIIGYKSHYIWIKADFEIPQELKNTDLGLFITYLHFSDKVWVNGKFAGAYGRFPPEELSSQYISHAYYFPKEVLNENGKNTILIQVYSHGKGELSGKVFVGDQQYIKIQESFTSFFNTYIYMFFQGGMFATCILFFFLYALRRKNVDYFWLSSVCISTMIFSYSLYAPAIPWFSSLSVSYYKFYRSSLCFCGILTVMLLSSFVRDYLKLKVSVLVERIRICFFILQIVILYSTKSYDDIMVVTGPIFLILFVHIGYFISLLIKGFRNKETYSKAKVISICFVPFVISFITDVIVRGKLNITTLPFFSYFGWQGTIILFLFTLSHNHAILLVRNEYLNENLRKEVDDQTKNLSIANRLLKDRISRAEIDLKMASIVQQKFFPYPTKEYDGWDLAITYKPLSEVSGDFYDCYSFGSNLTGLSLFDVSGHGIAASLVTMLSKNIVHDAFEANRYCANPVSQCLKDINEDLINMKGSIENYMTGLVLRFSHFDETDDSCKIELAGAGHPHPIVYSAENDLCNEVIGDTSIPQFGAIGMEGLECSYRDISFTMQIDDILICYTDGLTESQNKNNECFGKIRLMQIVEANHEKNAKTILQTIKQQLKDFVGDVERTDDITIIIMKRKKSGEFSGSDFTDEMLLNAVIPELDDVGELDEVDDLDDVNELESTDDELD